jgi:hypothetical protein
MHASINLQSMRTKKVGTLVMSLYVSTLCPYVNKASDWSLNKNKPIRGFVYIRACEFHYELLKFATFAEKLYEINCKLNSVLSCLNVCLIFVLSCVWLKHAETQSA